MKLIRYFLVKVILRKQLIKAAFVYFSIIKDKDMTLKDIKLSVLEYLQYERDERIPELIEMYDGDEQYVIDEIYGPLETILDGKTDEDLVNIIDEIMDAPKFESEFNEYKEYMDDEDDLETLYCSYVWECITNPIV